MIGSYFAASRQASAMPPLLPPSYATVVPEIIPRQLSRETGNLSLTRDHDSIFSEVEQPNLHSTKSVCQTTLSPAKNLNQPSVPKSLISKDAPFPKVKSRKSDLAKQKSRTTVFSGENLGEGFSTGSVRASLGRAQWSSGGSTSSLFNQPPAAAARFVRQQGSSDRAVSMATNQPSISFSRCQIDKFLQRPLFHFRTQCLGVGDFDATANIYGGAATTLQHMISQNKYSNFQLSHMSNPQIKQLDTKAIQKVSFTKHARVSPNGDRRGVDSELEGQLISGQLITSKGFTFEGFSIFGKPIQSFTNIPTPKLISCDAFFELKYKNTVKCLDGDRIGYSERSYAKDTVVHELKWKSYLRFCELSDDQQTIYKGAFVDSSLEIRPLDSLVFPTTHFVYLDNELVNATCKHNTTVKAVELLDLQNRSIMNDFCSDSQEVSFLMPTSLSKEPKSFFEKRYTLSTGAPVVPRLCLCLEMISRDLVRNQEAATIPQLPSQMTSPPVLTDEGGFL